jgi:hypothetical protein
LGKGVGGSSGGGQEEVRIVMYLKALKIAYDHANTARSTVGRHDCIIPTCRWLLINHALLDHGGKDVTAHIQDRGLGYT